MKNFTGIKLLIIVLFLQGGITCLAQEYDILIKNAHLIDPKNNIDQKMDVAISDGIIAEVSPQISNSSAETTINAEGLYITPDSIPKY